IIVYLAFLFVLPKVVDLNQFKPEIQKIAKEQTNLNLDFNNPKISVTPLLEAGFTADDIKITLPDNSEILTADFLKGRISIPFLFLKTFRVSTVEVENPLINVDIVDGNAFKAVQAYEEILNNREEKIEETIEESLQTAEKPLIDPASFKIVIPGIKISNYKALINDLKTGNYLKLHGDELKLGYNNGESISIKTIAELFINETKNITADIDIDTIIPTQSKLDEEDDKAQRVEIPFVNPVAMYMAYDLKTNVSSKIKVRYNKYNQIVSNGYFNVDNFTLKLAGLQLPESKFHVKSRGTKADIDTDLFITDEEKLTIAGMINYGKKPASDIKITSNEIHLDNVITLIKATLDSLHIKHELAPIKGEGYFIADTYIKTNFKKLKSQGNITVKDCNIKNTKTNQYLAKINSIISLDNSILKFVDTTVEAAETLFKIDGTIDEKSVADISVAMEKMPLQKVFTMFLPDEINNTYIVNSGFINLNADIKGELKKAEGKLNLTLNNISLTDKINKINYLNNLLSADFNSNFKTYTGDINNSDFKLIMNGAEISCDKLNVNIGENDITLAPSQIKINNASNINFEGYIKNYLKKPIINITSDGNLITKDLKQLLGSDLAMYIKENGTLPVSLSLAGNNKKQTLKASIEANADNYITPVDIDNVLGKNTIMQLVVDFKGDRLKIKDTGFFIKTVQQDPNDEEKTIVKLDEVTGIEGTITKLNTVTPNINLIKVKIPNDLAASMYVFPQSKLFANGNIYVFGDLKSPRIRGNFDIWNLSIPELMLKIEKIASKFEGKDLDVDIKNVDVNGSDYNILVQADLNPSEYFTVKNLNLMSKLTDVDKLMKVSEAAMKYVPASSEASSSSSNDIPVVLKGGSIDIKQIKTGNILLSDTTSKISLERNIFYVSNLITNAFKGKIKGDVSYNLISTELKAALKGSALDVEKALLDAAAMKDTLTGTMDFDTDISLKGSDYEEQMKSLKGSVNFTMKDGTLGPFGKLENLILAENIRESAFFQSTIGSVLSSLLSFDTSKYNVLNGKLTFDNGVVQINPIDTSGDIMAAYIFGDFNLLKNTIDIKLRGRLGSQVSDSMGPLALLNPVNLVKATPGMSLVLGKIFFLFTEQVTEAELSLIPSLGKDI
ncbi:MAG: hypothetical protein LUH05_08405, partial [Candidatus Gastranaerophilales bacterium]|nr:hypothetical protein [Candidatus Gastranaerophilales bacterium]